MKFLIDAQLPLRLAGWLKAHGHDALHTLDLPLGNRSSDSEITARATREDRIVITKDSDFVSSFLVTGNPPLLLISTGNISNAVLEALLQQNLAAIELAFLTHRFVEVTMTALISHE